ncbi:MAG: QueT transporter family protein [Candidatus Ranarchaeia archaeon]|jgi:uncharacterized membrane protein
MDFPVLQQKKENNFLARGWRSNRSLNIAISAVFGALYTALTILFAPISYFSVQIRVSEVLIAFIPIFGWPVLIGLTIGTLLGNVLSPLGIIDMVVGTIATFIGGLAVLYSKREPLSFTLYATIVSIIVGSEIAFIFSLPLVLTIVEVFLGETISAVMGGSIVYLAARRVFPKQPSDNRDTNLS